MSICMKMTVGSAGKAGATVLYDTRLIATKGEQERVWTHNVPGYVDRADGEVSYKERRDDLTEFMRQLEEDELLRSGKPKVKGEKKDQTFYRFIYSFHDKVSDEKARQMVSEHLREEFPKGIAVCALHRNTQHTHVHVVMAARQTDGRKLHFDRETYRSIDESWARIYGREFGKEHEVEHLRKKDERREHRRVARAAIERPPPRPERVSHSRNQIQERIKTSEREHGIRSHGNETRVRGNERPATTQGGETEGAVAERAFAGSRRRERPSQGRDSGAARSTGGVGDATGRIAELGTR